MCGSRLRLDQATQLLDCTGDQETGGRDNVLAGLDLRGGGKGWGVEGATGGGLIGVRRDGVVSEGKAKWNRLRLVRPEQSRTTAGVGLLAVQREGDFDDGSARWNRLRVARPQP